MTPLDRYLVTFTADGIPNAVALLDRQATYVSGGYGGWTVVQRERRVGLTVWQGKDPLRMQVSLLFDGVNGMRSQELPISYLSRMAMPPTKLLGEPPTVRIAGRGVPRPGPVDWVIETIDWGTNVMYDFDQGGSMVRLRQDAVVHLLQYVAGDRAAFKSIPPATPQATGWPKQYIVKPGDTLQKIAVQFYKDSGKWKQIADANNIRDPKKPPVGKTIRIPAP
jgi:hypothetical protein